MEVASSDRREIWVADPCTLLGYAENGGLVPDIQAQRYGAERVRDLSTPLDMTTTVFAVLHAYHDATAHSAAMNMAIDEALLESAIVPCVRFYRWQSAALSFGYFGKFAEVASYASERDLVRRWTGGGIVLHENDLTYSIVIPARDQAFAESSIVIYESIHRALCAALNAMGKRAFVAASLNPGGASVAQHAGVSAIACHCFANPVRADVMLDSRKIAGAAQRRTRRGLLQQGSIQSIRIHTNLAERFAASLSAGCSRRELTKEVLQRARELARQKYEAESWLRKR
jgi:lipoyl(octanoyl) transferase